MRSDTCEGEKQKRDPNIGPTLTIMTKFHVELPKAIQTVHDKLNSITHKAARQRVQAFKALINQDFAQVDAWHDAEKRADAARKASPPRPPAPPLQQPQRGAMPKPIPVPPPTPMKAKVTPPAPPPRQGVTVKPIAVPPPTPMTGKARPPAPPPQSAKPGAKPKAMAGTAPDRGPPPPVPPFNRQPSGQK